MSFSAIQKFIALTLILALAWLSPSWSAGAGTTRAEQKRSAESEHAELRKKLNELKKDIHHTESAKQRAEDALAHSEAAISTSNRKLVELAAEQRRTEKKLAELIEQQQQLQTQIEHQRKQFAALLRKQYETGNTDRVKLLLSGDNPNRIHRDLHYFGYLTQSQQKLIAQLRENLAAVDANKLAMEQIKHDLDEIAQEQRQQKTDLVKEQNNRADLLKKLNSKLTAQRKEAGQLQKNEQRLATLVERLNRLIAEQRKNAKRQQEKRRTNTNAASAPIQVTETPEADGDTSHGQFSRLKGRLRLPTKGQLTAKYGSQRGEGAVWKGLFIRANEGAEIKSIAPGKVVFAEWLRGFGNLIILDHGAQYMSIYGNNQALMKQAGDSVSTGDVIATVGNSGGNDESGLYFELRHQGKTFDPLSWLSSN